MTRINTLAVLVRLEGTKEAVAFITAPTRASIANLVDQVCDPEICEYLPAGEGGLVWLGSKAPSFDPDVMDAELSDDDQSDEGDIMRGATIDEYLFNRLFSSKNKEWKSYSDFMGL